MGKRPPMDEVEEYKYSLSSPRAGQPFYTEKWEHQTLVMLHRMHYTERPVTH